MSENISPNLSRRTAIWILIAIMLLAGGLRLWVINRSILPPGDGAGSNMELGVNLLAGRGFESDRKWTFYGPWGEWGPIPHPEGNQQPLTAILVAGAISIGGVDYRCGQVLAMLLSLGALLVLYAYTNRRFKRKVALVAVVLGAISSSQIWFGANLDTQVTFQLLTLLFLWAGQAWLTPLPRGSIKLGTAFALGLIAGVGYLTRANGILFLIALWLWLLFWSRVEKEASGGWFKRFFLHIWRIIPACLMSLLGFFILALPWLWRNHNAFGSPFFSENSYFIYTDDFWGMWSVRPTIPTAGEWFARHGLGEFIIKELRGVYAAIEPFFLGNLHRQELYVEGPLVAFTIFALIWLFKRGEWRKDGLVLILLALHILALASHRHTFRYMLPFYLLVYAYGVAGMSLVWHEMGAIKSGFGRIKRWQIRGILTIIILLILSPMIRPLAMTLRYDDRPRGRELYKALDYIHTHTSPSAVIADFPVTEKMIWKYQRLTILTPHAPADVVLGVFSFYKPELLVVTPEMLATRPGIKEWFRIDDDGKIADLNLPPTFSRVWTGTSGKTVIYRIKWDDALPASTTTNLVR